MHKEVFKLETAQVATSALVLFGAYLLFKIHWFYELLSDENGIPFWKRWPSMAQGGQPHSSRGTPGRKAPGWLWVETEDFARKWVRMKIDPEIHW